MGVITLPQSMERDRENNVKANSAHVDENFDTLLTAVNKKLEQDGSIVPTADLPMGNHKITGLALPTASGDAATKGFVEQYACMLAGAQTITGNKLFTGTISAPTVASPTDNSTKVATTEFVVDVLKAMYPVGAIFLGTQNTCPMSAFFGTWELVSSGKALWTGDGTNGNTTVDAGLPNITGQLTGIQQLNPTATGAFSVVSTTSRDTGTGHSGGGVMTISISAQKSSSIYGNSSTVQPPAYVVNVWRRTA